MINIKFRFIFITLLIYLLIILAGCGNTTPTVANIGDKAPNFTLESLDGGKISLSDYQNKTLLIVVRKVHCKGCEMQAPFIDNAFDKADGKLVVLNVFKQESKDIVEKHVQEKQLTRYPVLLDPDGVVAGRYGVDALPTSFLVGKDGTVLRTCQGLTVDLENELALFLSEE